MCCVFTGRICCIIVAGGDSSQDEAEDDVKQITVSTPPPPLPFSLSLSYPIVVIQGLICDLSVPNR